MLVLTAVLADAINLGVTRMTDACPGISPGKLGRINTLYILDETYTKARAQIVNYHHELAFAANFGQGTTSSSDAQRFRAGGRGEATVRINPRYGHEPGALFCTHVSDHNAPVYSQLINATARDATYVLDKLLSMRRIFRSRSTTLTRPASRINGCIQSKSPEFILR